MRISGITSTGVAAAVWANATRAVTALPFPAADAVTNTDVSQVIGNKADAAQVTVTATRSIIAYCKGLLSNLRLKPTSVETASDATNTAGAGGTWRQLIAASAAPVQKMYLKGLLQSDGVGDFTISLGTGGVGAEVVRAISRYNTNIAAVIEVNLEVELEFASGTRIAWKYDRLGGTAQVYMGAGLTVEER